MRLLVLIGGLLVNLYCVQPVRAEVINADGTAFDLQMPKGYCAMSRTNDKEKGHYALQDRMQKEVNTVLLIAIPCDDVREMHAGKPWKQWMIWLLNGKPGQSTRVPAGMGRADVVRELAKAMPSLDMNLVRSKIDKAVESEGLQLKLRNMNVIAKDDDALYTAQTVAVAGGAGAREIAVVTGWVALNDHILTLNTYSDYKDAASLDTLQARAKDTLMRTIAANEKK
ncbi:MAG TPA: hypothetical protein P5114_09390 [Hyphomicrobiaceae bacterium]|nr:hypothetical protein [Hyphomicrobiaceae bacterium]